MHIANGVEDIRRRGRAGHGSNHIPISACVKQGGRTARVWVRLAFIGPEGYGFGDGPHNTLIAFWRTADDARAFAARPEHRAAVRGLYYQAAAGSASHFAAIWEITSNHDRVIFCPDCQTATPAAHQRCGGCGAELSDPYRA